MHPNFVRTVALLAFAALLASACANYKEPAQAAITEAETALQTIAADAQRYVPDRYQEVSDALTSAKAAFDKGDYKAALATARDLPARVADLGAAATAAKSAALDRLTGDWNTLSADVPKMVDAIQSRVDMLSKSRRLPKNIDQASFDAAKSGLDTIKQAWTDATQAFSAGNVEEAVAKARTAHQKGAEVLGLLGLTPSA